MSTLENVHVCGGAVRYTRQLLDQCPVCKITNAWVVASVSTPAWWSDITTCTNCGDSWGDGCLLERPFHRGWRTRSINRARARWEVSCDCPVRWDEQFTLLPCEHEVAA